MQYYLDLYCYLVPFSYPAQYVFVLICCYLFSKYTSNLDWEINSWTKTWIIRCLYSLQSSSSFLLWYIHSFLSRIFVMKDEWDIIPCMSVGRLCCCERSTQSNDARDFVKFRPIIHLSF